MGCMGKVTVQIPLITWRDGRPRFIPGPTTQALGFKGQDLRHGKDGKWYSLDEAIAWSEKKQKQIADMRAAVRSGDITAKQAVKATAAARLSGLVSIAHVVETFLDSPPMQGKAIVLGKKRREPLAANTIRSYKGSARLLRGFDGGAVWVEPAADLSGKALSGLLDEIEVANGLAQARAVRALVSAAYGYGRSKGLIHNNPIDELETTLPVLEPDVRPGTIEEIETLIAVCDVLGFADVGDVVAAGPWTGQRQNDRLALQEDQINAEGILFRPHKKKRSREQLLVPLARCLRRRLQAAAERRKAWKVTNLKPGHVFLCEAMRKPWQADWYRKHFRVLKFAAAFGEYERYDSGASKGEITREARMLFGTRDIGAELAAAGITPLASLADFNDKHLRDTCLSWLALAGADKFETAGFSGHAFGKDDAILKHYVAVPPEFARRGMVKLEAWHTMRLAEIEGAKKEAEL